MDDAEAETTTERRQNATASACDFFSIEVVRVFGTVRQERAHGLGDREFDEEMTRVAENDDGTLRALRRVADVRR
jgi:hypothetical protein